MNRKLSFRRPTIFGFVLSIVMTIIFFITETPFLIALIFCLSLFSIITSFLMLIEILNKKNDIEKKQILNSIIVSVISIPILLIFIFVSYHFSKSTRVDIINNTDQTVEHWEINGCENVWRDNQYPKQKEIVWLDLTGDCSVEIEITQNGIKRNETVIGNLKPGLFSKIEFYIQPQKIE